MKFEINSIPNETEKVHFKSSVLKPAGGDTWNVSFKLTPDDLDVSIESVVIDGAVGTRAKRLEIKKPI